MKQTISVKIAPEMKDRLAQLVLTKDRSIHWLLTQAITRYVEQEERRESIKTASLDAWINFQMAGVGVPSKDVCDWLSDLAQGKYRNPPL